MDKKEMKNRFDNTPASFDVNLKVAEIFKNELKSGMRSKIHIHQTADKPRLKLPMISERQSIFNDPMDEMLQDPTVHNRFALDQIAVRRRQNKIDREQAIIQKAQDEKDRKRNEIEARLEKANKKRVLREQLDLKQIY